MSTEQSKALVRRFEEEVWNGRNPSRVDEFFAASHIFRAARSLPLDREGHRQMIAHFQSAFPDGLNTTDDLIADEDRVAQRWTYRGTHRGAFQGIPPTGRQVTLTGISIWRIEGGKIVESWHELDTLGLMQQLGVIPDP
ncbi:MAG TPA: ester cyclase [Gemmatimonadales bacterium]|nr:ester cyclase [Gemmatimonadales bacterium]